MTVNGFDKEGFMHFLEQTFSGFDNSFLRGTVENLIDYALKHENHSLDQMCYFLSDLLPEVDFAEVSMFMDDSMLTYHGRELKKEAIDDLRDPGPEEDLITGSLDDLVAAALKQQRSQGPDFGQMPLDFESVFVNR